MPFSRRLLHLDEDIYYEARPHWIELLPAALFSGAVLAGGVAGFVLWSRAPTWFGLVLLGALGLAALSFGARVVQWRARVFVITSHRVIARVGVIRRVGKETPIERVQDVTYHQRILERLVGSGSLVIESAGERGAMTIAAVRRPDLAQMQISAAISGRLSIEERAPAAEPADDVSHQLATLGELHERGILTDGEFEEKKAQLLAQM